MIISSVEKYYEILAVDQSSNGQIVSTEKGQKCHEKNLELY